MPAHETIATGSLHEPTRSPTASIAHGAVWTSRERYLLSGRVRFRPTYGCQLDLRTFLRGSRPEVRRR